MATDSPFRNIRACVFYAYGTLLDVNSAAARCGKDLGDREKPLSELWRAKQLQYTWLSSLMGRHKDFRTLTRAGLTYAMAAHGLDDGHLTEKLMQQYEVLEAYPEAPAMLHDIRTGGTENSNPFQRHAGYVE